MSNNNNLPELPVDYDSFAGMLVASPFHDYFKFELGAFDPDTGVLEIRMPYHAGLNRSYQSEQIHGGAMAVLIDVAATYSVLAKTRKGVPTVDLRIDYMRPGVSSTLTAKAVVRRAGRTLGTADVDVTDDDGKLVAIGRGTFMTG